jgi:hypothetical protein
MASPSSLSIEHTLDPSRASTLHWGVLVYNGKRLHSALGYLSQARFVEVNTREAA